MKIASLLAALILGVIVFAHAGDGKGHSSVNGSVKAAPGETVDSLSTVNGNVQLGKGARAGSAKAVNGDIHLDADATAGTTSTVNGSLHIAEGAVVEREASTVNGSVEIEQRARVGGDVTTVNGSIDLRGAQIDGKLLTTSGDIGLTDGARVRGGIHVRANRGMNWGWGKDRPVHVRICGTCEVGGTLKFDRPVVLQVESGAKIGQVIGDEVTRR